jgi:hypothetical protein
VSFSRIGDFSIAAGTSYRVDGFSWPDGSDQGAIYFSTSPSQPNAKLVISEHNKVWLDTGWYYGFRVTNEGPADSHFSVEGGGFNYATNYLKPDPPDGSIDPGISMRSYWYAGEDFGGVWLSAHPAQKYSKLVTNEQYKEQIADPRSNGAPQTEYSFQLTNEGPDAVFVFLQGGGFISGFNGVGHYTIGAVESFRIDGWSWPDGSDQGAIYLSANPLDQNSPLIMSEQNKMLGIDNRWYYGFRVTNPGPNPTSFDVQGGGFA